MLLLECLTKFMGCKKLAYCDLENTAFLRVVKCAEHEIFGVSWYDYGARMYDPALARFHTLDPMAEAFPNQSPYVYADNDPVKNIDFMGMNSMVGADGLTNEQWVEASRPGADPGLTKQYQQQNRNNELADNSSVSVGAISEGTFMQDKNLSSDEELNQLWKGISLIMRSFAYSAAEDKFIQYCIDNKVSKTIVGYVYYRNHNGEITADHLFNSKYSTDLGSYINTNKKEISGTMTLPGSKAEVFLLYQFKENTMVDNFKTSDNLNSYGLVQNGPAIILQRGARERAYLIFNDRSGMLEGFNTLYTNQVDKRYNQLLKMVK
jgi:RHS repeat-associated protein